MRWPIGFLAVSVLGLLSLTGSVSAPPAPPEKQPPWKLAEARAEAAERATKLFAEDYLQGRATFEQVQQWSQRWMNAQRDLTTKKGDQFAAQEAHVKRMQDLEKAAKDKVAAKRAPASEAAVAEYFRLGAELDLSKARTSK